jgi:NADP-dependent 3-hydroxy acid dehydrogenase YdfG
MNRMSGKTVMVTGASSGIGEACARLFASHGCNLVLAARRGDRLEKLRNYLEGEFDVTVLTHVLDVRDRQAVEAFASEVEAAIGCPDVLVNNAGLASGMSKLHDGDHDDWDRMIDTNIKGLLNVSRCIVPTMIERDSGHVINIGSIAGHIVYPMGNVYNATKFAVRALNEGMAIDLVGTNVRVSSVDPGAAETEFSEVRFHGDKDKAKTVYKGFKPLSGDDVAEAVYFVANAPSHVNVLDLVILPTAQRSPYVLHRREE